MKTLLAPLAALVFLGTMGCGNKSTCPSNTRECGNGCIPALSICCDVGSTSGSSYCTNGVGGISGGQCTANTASRNCPAAFPSGTSAAYCCANNTNSFGSNDCPAGQHHCGLLCTTQECSSSPGADAGAGTDAGAGSDAGLPDPCGVAGNWTTDCPSTSCSGCTISVSGSDSFTISPEIAANGGMASGGSGTHRFTVSTCTMNHSWQTSGGCFTGTRSYDFVLMNGHGSQSQTFQCWDTGTNACICTGSYSPGCTDTRN